MKNSTTTQPKLAVQSLGALLLAVTLAAAPARAQQQLPPQSDPLMSLMLSQPPLDTTSAVRPTAVFDPPLVRPGEPSTYRVTFNALEQFIAWPTNLVAPPQLALRPGAHAQILQMTGTNMIPLTSFNTRVRPSTVGEFVIPEFTVTVDGKPVIVPAARLEAAAELPPGTLQFQELLLELRGTNLHVGQPVVARVVFPGAPGTFPQLTQTQLAGEGVLVDQSSVRPRYEPTARGGITVMNAVSEITVTPITTGKLSIFAQGFAISNRPQGAGSVTFGPGTIVLGGLSIGYTLLDSEPIQVEVSPLPRDGQLPGFTGAIGTFTLEEPRLAATQLRVGEPVKLTVRVRGGPGLARLVPPPAPHVDDWQILPADDSALPPQMIQAQGVTVFGFNLVPLSQDSRATPTIPFSYFDPKKAAYVDLSIPSVAVTVRPGSTPADVQALQQPDVAESGEPEPMLSGLATAPGRVALSLTPVQLQPWFALLQLVPAAGFLGLWYWDRRRRFLEAHPEIVRCRRARRALHRQRRALRRAIRAGDAPGFVAAAVGALRVACAPHLPAEPQALVGADVLHVVAAGAASPSAVAPALDLVRRFFSLTDAARFSTGSVDPAGLLAAHAQLEDLLEGLDQRLCA